MEQINEEFFKCAQIEEINNHLYNKTVVVSVWCLTYNQKKYIKETLDGILSQKTKYSYKIVLFDDASKDGTAEIIKEYANKYPEIIHAFLAKDNTYNHPNRSFYMKWLQEKYLTGKYIAVCEGDDYWIDETKLQRQVRFLEKNSEYSMVVHNAIIFNISNAHLHIMNAINHSRKLTEREIINHNIGYIATATMVFKRSSIYMEEFYYQSGVGDYTLRLNSLRQGNIYFMDKIMSVYRYGHENSWQQNQQKNSVSRMTHCISMIRFLDYYDSSTNHKYLKYILNEIQLYVSVIMSINMQENFGGFIKKIKLGDYIEDYYVKEIERLYNCYKESMFLDINTKNFVEDFSEIYVMGTGKFAKLLTEQLNNNNISFDGYVVSFQKDKKAEFEGKPVKILKEVSNKSQKVGVLIGICPNKWDEIEACLQKNKITNYYCPFIFQQMNPKL